jgi:hypothetical protein
MFAPFTLALALAAAAQSAPTATGLEVIARTTQNGRTTVTSLFTTTGDLRRPQTMFVSVRGSICSGLTVSKEEPPNATHAWRISTGPVTYAPASRAPVRADVMVTTQRMWLPGENGPDALRFLALPTQDMQRSGVLDMLSIAGGKNPCDASVSLEARLLPEATVQRPVSKLLEAELWFVHKAPNGKETSQRQVVRVRQNGRGEFYFDDIELQTRWLEADINLTVEVFGALVVGEPDQGEILLTLDLTRRYLTKQFLIGSWPKSGSTALPTKVALGEVVSFVLPPLTDDSGVFLGHRFSVRLRIKPVGDDELAARQ